MSCRDAVYSNDYYNFIIRNSAYLAGYEPGECHIDLDSLYTIEFAKREGLPPLSLGNYTYASIRNAIHFWEKRRWRPPGFRMCGICHRWRCRGTGF